MSRRKRPRLQTLNPKSEAALRGFGSTYIDTYVHACIRTGIHTQVHTYSTIQYCTMQKQHSLMQCSRLHAYNETINPTYLPIELPTYPPGLLPTYPPVPSCTHPPTRHPTHLPTHVRTYVRTYIQHNTCLQHKTLQYKPYDTVGLGATQYQAKQDLTRQDD